MSLPLKRRIAQAALIVAAGAVPVIAAGSASAVDLSKAPDLGGLTHMDPANAGGNVQTATHVLGQEAAPVAGSVVEHGLPVAADAAGQTVGAALPAAKRTVGDLTGRAAGAASDTTSTTGSLAGGATRALHNRSAVADASPMGGLGETAQGLPSELPAVDGLPLGKVGSLLGGATAQRSLPADSPLPTGALPKTGTPVDTATGLLSGVTSGGGASNRLGGAPGLSTLTEATPVGALGPVAQLLGGLGQSGIGQ